jgi:hypothetical protein
MNKKWMPHGITAGALAVFIVLGLACASEPSVRYEWDAVYHGEQNSLLEGTKWIFKGSHSSYGTCDVEFNSEGRFWGDMDTLGSGTWERNGYTVKINTGVSSLVGTYNPQSKRITGTGKNSGWKEVNVEFNWAMDPLGGSIGAASGGEQQVSGQQESNIPQTRSYTVTVWYTESGGRKSIPVVVSAASKDEAEREAERQWKNIYGWNNKLQFIEAVGPIF